VTLAAHLFSGVCGVRELGKAQMIRGVTASAITWVRTQIAGKAALLTNVTLEWSLACLHLSVKVA